MTAMHIELSLRTIPPDQIRTHLDDGVIATISVTLVQQALQATAEVRRGLVSPESTTAPATGSGPSAVKTRVALEPRLVGPQLAALRADDAGPRPVTGPGITNSVGMNFADLGIMRWDPARNAIAAMFGDNFSFSWGQDWESPSIVMYDDSYNACGIPETGNRIVTAPRRQLWPYPHSNPCFDTVLPCDFIRVGDWWYVAVMLSKGTLDDPGAQWRTEFWRSPDLVSWQGPILMLDHRPPSMAQCGAGIPTGHPGNTMLTFDQIGDTVYIFGTGGLIRSEGIWMWKNSVDQFPLGQWVPWGYDGQNWDWGNANEDTPILEGKYGELSFRYLQGNCVLSYFDAENRQLEARTVPNPWDDWRDTVGTVVYASGAGFDGTPIIPNLYGGYISPLSRLNEPDGMAFLVSQWIDTDNYRVYLVRDTLRAQGAVAEQVATPDARAKQPTVASPLSDMRARSATAPQADSEDLLAPADTEGPRWVTGPGITTGVHMDAADLGIMRWDPDRNAIAAMFGDNWPLVGMLPTTEDPWESPSIVMYNSDYRVTGIPQTRNRIVMAPRRQLWNYDHGNPCFDTVLPCDFIRIGDWWHVAVMLSKGKIDLEGAQWRTEFWRSRDLVNWQGPTLMLDHRPPPNNERRCGFGIPTDHPGNTMLTFDRIDDTVYIFGTGGLVRNKGIRMWRNPASQFPLGRWEPWGRDGQNWGWGIPNESEDSSVLQGAYGELCFRYLQGNCVLSYFDAGAYRQEARTVKNPWDDWGGTPGSVVYASGAGFDGKPIIPNLYGGYISPLSRLNEPNGMAFFVSQWEDNSNYRVWLVRDTLAAQGEIGESLLSPNMIEPPPVADGSTSPPRHGEGPAIPPRKPAKRAAAGRAAQRATTPLGRDKPPTKKTTGDKPGKNPGHGTGPEPQR
jgi:hypothetical protein